MIENLGSKLYSGTKSDRKSDSLGSSADGANTGITLMTTSGTESQSGTGENKGLGQSMTGGNATKMGFTVATGHALVGTTATKISLYLWKDGSPTGNGSMKIYNSSGTLQATSTNTVSWSGLGSSSWGNKTDFTFTGHILANGDRMVIEGGTTNDSNRVFASMNTGTASNTETVYYSDTWRTISNAMKFDVEYTDSDAVKLGTGAYEFAGTTSSYVDIGSGSQFPQGAAARTITAWFKTSESNNDVRAICGWGSSSTAAAYVIGLYTNSGIFITGYSSPQWTSGSGYADGNYHHLATTYDGTTHKIYVDGTEIDSRSATFNTGGSNNGKIGMSAHATSENFDGEIDDVSIWKRVLTATEIGKLVNNNDPAISFSNYTGASSVDLSATTSSRLGTLIGDSGKFDTVKVELRVIGSHTSSNVVKLIVVKKSDNSVLATSNTKTIADLTGTGGDPTVKTEYTFTFASPVTVTAGDYYLFCEYPYGDASDYLGLGRSASGVSNYPWTYNSASGSSYTENTGQSMKAVISGTGGSAQLVSSLTNKSNLKAYYSMDTESGAADGVGADGDADSQSGITLDTTNKKVGSSSYDFASGGVIFKEGEQFGVSGQNSFTISMWVRFDSLGSNETIFRLMSTNGSADVEIGANSGNVFGWFEAQSKSWTTSPSNSTWYHLVFRRVWGDKDYYYLDGSEVNTNTTQVAIDVNSSNIWYLGRRKEGTEALNGQIDEMGIWERALTTTEISNLYNSGNGASVDSISTTGLKCHWNFEQTPLVNQASLKCPNDFSATSDLEALTGVRTNSIFQQSAENGATPSYWWFNGTSWVLDGTTENPIGFASGDWVENDSAKIGVSSGSLSFNMVRDGSNDACVYDLTSVSNDKWALRFKINFSAISGGSSNGNDIWIGLSDKDESAGSTTSQDFIGIDMNMDNTNVMRSATTNDAAFPLGAGSSTVNWTPSTSTDYYVQIIRTSSTNATIDIFSDSSYSTKAFTTLSYSVSSSTQSLRYIKIANRVNSGGGRTITGTIDDMKFQDGVSEWVE